MVKLFIIGIILWLILFSLRVLQIGGVDFTYRDSSVELLLAPRKNLTELIDQILPYPQSALLSGILLGSQTEIPHTLKQQLKSTSTIHMMVASGQNLTILAGFVMSLVAFLGRKKTIILTLGTIGVYTVLTGAQVPIIRAALMVSLAYLAQILGKEKVGWWTLVLVGGLMLIYNPNWLISISFQLSFLATFGVVVVSPVFLSAFQKIPTILRQDLAITMAAQLMVAPIIAYNFGQISLVGILANSLILWVIPIVMVDGVLALLGGMFLVELGQLIGIISGILLTYFLDVVKIFSTVPGASLTVGQTGVLVWIGYYFILGAIIWMIKIQCHSE